jgi:hypothetical protein
LNYAVEKNDIEKNPALKARQAVHERQERPRANPAS